MVTRTVIKERLLLGGESGSGKTFQCLALAEALPQSQFFVIECDDGSRRLLSGEFRDVKNYKPLLVMSWGEEDSVRDALSDLDSLVKRGQMGADDFVVVDGADIISQLIRNEFAERAIVTRTNPDKRKGAAASGDWDSWDAKIAVRSRGAPLFEPSDWDVVNGEFEINFLAYLAYRIPCHLIMTTSVSAFQRDSKYEDPMTKDFYASIGQTLKFEGQKRLPRAFDTLIYLFHGLSDYSFMVSKDRGGRSAAIIGERQPLKDIYADFLVKYAGWQ